VSVRFAEIVEWDNLRVLYGLIGLVGLAATAAGVVLGLIAVSE
jgi:hypothetical protein